MQQKMLKVGRENLEKQRTDGEVLRQSTAKHNSDENEVPKVLSPF